jgi:hypothetical protein
MKTYNLIAIPIAIVLLLMAVITDEPHVLSFALGWITTTIILNALGIFLITRK